MVAEAGGPMLEKRAQDADYERRSAAHLDELTAGRMRNLEAELARSRTGTGSSAPTGARRGAVGCYSPLQVGS